MYFNIERICNLGLSLAAIVVLIISFKKRGAFKTDKKRKAIWLIGLCFLVLSWLLPLVFTTILPRLVRLTFWIFIPWYVTVLMKADAVFCFLVCLKSAGKGPKPAVWFAIAAVVFCVCAALTVSYTLSLNVIH